MSEAAPPSQHTVDLLLPAEIAHACEAAGERKVRSIYVIEPSAGRGMELVPIE